MAPSELRCLAAFSVRQLFLQGGPETTPPQPLKQSQRSVLATLYCSERTTRSVDITATLGAQTQVVVTRAGDVELRCADVANLVFRRPRRRPRTIVQRGH